MQPASDKYIDQARAIVLAHTRGLPVEVYFFGSRATGKPRRDSDVDVAVDIHGPVPTAFLSDLSEALEESSVPYRVDVVDLSAASEKFRARVKSEGIKWSG